jgi:MarR family transcriptional regulator, organic hydroperoxide resistance regulator
MREEDPAPDKARDGAPRRPGKAEEALRLDRQLCFALYSASAAMTRAYRPLLEPLGLTYPQYIVMLVLWESSPRTVGELGSVLGHDSATLTPLLKRLEASGLVSRKRDPKDERRVLIAPTAAGEKLKQEALGIPEALLCLLPLPGDEVVELRQSMKRLTSGLNEANQK